MLWQTINRILVNIYERNFVLLRILGNNISHIFLQDYSLRNLSDLKVFDSFFSCISLILPLSLKIYWVNQLLSFVNRLRCINLLIILDWLNSWYFGRVLGNYLQLKLFRSVLDTQNKIIFFKLIAFYIRLILYVSFLFAGEIGNYVIIVLSFIVRDAFLIQTNFDVSVYYYIIWLFAHYIFGLQGKLYIKSYTDFE